jgi:hypothetical protein
MGYIKRRIKALIKESGSKARARTAAEEWFNAAIKSRAIKEAKATRDRFLPGKIYVFQYRPITENLPWWDKNPVVLSIEQKDQTDLGVNLNLLPVEFKERLLDRLYDMMEGQIKSASVGKSGDAINQRPLRITYDGMKAFLDSEGYGFALRQYRPERKINQAVVSYEKWADIVLCDFIDLEGTTIGAVKRQFKKSL